MVIDFVAIKERFPVELVMERMLRLPMTRQDRRHADDPEQWRGVCPHCQSNDPRAFVVTKGKGAYCHDMKRGGDVIWMVSHIRQIPFRQSAEEILTFFEGKEEQRTPPPSALEPLTYLVHDHADVDALKLTPEVAEAIGIGFANRGMMRSRVAVPIRLPDGTLIGYLGIAQGADVKFPTNLAEKI